jgi:hypothetical protein
MYASSPTMIFRPLYKDRERKRRSGRRRGGERREGSKSESSAPASTTAVSEDKSEIYMERYRS